MGLLDAFLNKKHNTSIAMLSNNTHALPTRKRVVQRFLEQHSLLEMFAAMQAETIFLLRQQQTVTKRLRQKIRVLKLQRW